MGWFQRLFGRQPPAAPATVAAPAPSLTPRPLRVSDDALAALRGMPPRRSPFMGVPTPPPGVRPAGDKPPVGMAMDEASGPAGGEWGIWAQEGLWGEGLWFMGYPYLAELSQRPEYRNISETVAEEMTRKWVALRATGNEDKSGPIGKLEAAMKRYGLRDAFYRATVLDGLMGMGMIYIDTGDSNNPEELMMPLLKVPAKIGKGKLRGFVPLDPTWVSPQNYNSVDPLRDDYLKPVIWYVMGKRVHHSRLLIIRSREVPDLLKASYNFGGMSLSQMAKPYVDNWLRTRQSVSDLLHAFTTWVLSTNMGAYLQDAEALAGRLGAFIFGRDNRGLMLVDKETETLTNVSAPLGGLDKLQAQAQEQMASVDQIPIMKLFGVTPTGLNSTADNEVRVWYDRVRARQERTYGAALTDALAVIQLSEIGKIDDEIEFEFLPLWELDAAGKAAVEKTKADTDSVRIADGIISPDEARTAIAADPESAYHGLEGPPPDPPELDEIDPDKSDVAGRIEKEGAEGSETEANSGA